MILGPKSFRCGDRKPLSPRPTQVRSSPMQPVPIPEISDVSSFFSPEIIRSRDLRTPNVGLSVCLSVCHKRFIPIMMMMMMMMMMMIIMK